MKLLSRLGISPHKLMMPQKKTALDMALAERGQLEQVYMTNPECLL